MDQNIEKKEGEKKGGDTAEEAAAEHDPRRLHRRSSAEAPDPRRESSGSTRGPANTARDQRCHILRG